MHFQPQSPPSGEVTEILADLIGGFQDNAQDVILAAMAQDCRLISYQAHRVTGGSPTITDVVDLAGLVVGTVDNTALASNLNFVPTAAPWNYGHFYLCGIPDVDFTENRFTPNYLTLAGNVAAKVSSAFVGNVPAVTATWVPIVFERKTQSGRTIGFWQVGAQPTVMKRRMRPWAG